ncbi:MAG: carboxypeptidase Taq [Cellvibrionaceae bacterium]|jgi:carboxypeptidase Taq
MGKNYQKLLEQVNEIHDLDKVTWLMGWDREVNMPDAAAGIRSKQIGTVNKLVHRLSTSDEMGELIENAAAELEGEEQDPQGTEQSLIRFLKRDFAEKKRIPEDFVRRQTEARGHANQVWKSARENNDFAPFASCVATTIALCQEMAEYLGYEDEKYDALLSQYERGLKTADVRRIFNAIKEETVPLIEAIADRQHLVDDSLLHQNFPVDIQKEVAPYFAKAVGYNFEHGTQLGTAAHPFASSFSRFDARITTRWYPDFISPSLFGTMHESGHAMYEQGTAADLERTPLARGTSMGIHESQSRMMENLVGRSRSFWEVHYPVLQKAFPQQLGAHSAEDFYRAINKVSPSYIRVEADELTYNMHIMLRFELEQAMVNGDITAEQLPEAWNSKMEELLGSIPPTDTLGCLQDIHWTGTSFGYFPTYALGNFYSVQLLDAAQTQDPSIQTDLAQGSTAALKKWLGENIHAHGKKFDPAELVTKATGRPLDHKPFVAYAKAKFGELYNL